MWRLRKFWGLSSADKRLFIRAVFTISALKLFLLTIPFKTLRRWIDKRTQKHPEQPVPTGPSQERIIWAVDLASQYVPRTKTCLPRALAAELMLARAGYPAEFKIGVTRGQEGAFQAHAWVELSGKVVIGGSASPLTFTTLPSIKTEGS